MSDSNKKPSSVSGAIYTVAILGTFLIIGWLAWLMLSTKPAPIGADRSVERRKAAADLKLADTEILNNIGWQDQSKNLVRLPVDLAMQVTIQKAKDPKAARADLLARLDKATAVPPKAPEQPSEFE
ncbi:MAG: hypothetical protein H0X66_10455 [Verrucomicrobia bacterium]|jgi:hypothetical protein|nr:hypothetical protein [Verrucomicrobiota bacterium]